MKKKILSMGIVVLMLVLTMLSFEGISHQKLHVALANESKEKNIRVAFDQKVKEIIESEHVSGATAIIIKDGEAILQQGYGYSDKKLDQTVNKRTGFRIGSISKTFVSIAALIAKEDGKLDFNVDISEYLEKDFPKFKYPITMNKLLTHTAGFEDQITGIAVKNLKDMEPLSISLRKYRPNQIFKPGEVISYSNYGVALAAYVIEKATGVDFAQYCTDRIFNPLNMKDTTFLYNNMNIDISKAYSANGEEAFEPYINIYAEGSVISTAEDMGKYLRWLLGDDYTILSKDLKLELFQSHFSPSEDFKGIGYIWNIKSRNGDKYFEKKGETVNFYSRIVLFPSKNTGVFFSFNTYVPEEKINEVTKEITDILLGEKGKFGSINGATIRMEGNYINTFSNFDTAEKILSYINPEKRIGITGSLEKGYKLNGEPMIHVGNNIYESNVGKIKLIQKDSHTFLVIDPSQTYIKINICESFKLNITVLLMFLLSIIIHGIWQITSLIKRKKIIKITRVCYIVILISFFSLCSILFFGLTNYRILQYSLLIQITSWIILLTTLASVSDLLVISKDKLTTYNKLYLYVYNFINVLFCFLLSHMHFL